MLFRCSEKRQLTSHRVNLNTNTKFQCHIKFWTNLKVHWHHGIPVTKEMYSHLCSNNNCNKIKPPHAHILDFINILTDLSLLKPSPYKSTGFTCPQALIHTKKQYCVWLHFRLVLTEQRSTRTKPSSNTSLRHAATGKKAQHWLHPPPFSPQWICRSRLRC